MGIEAEKPRNLKEAKTRYITHWSDIASRLPSDLDPHYTNFIKDYYRAQLRIARGQKKRAKRILDGLDKRTGFLEFEENHEDLLAAIDIAVKGSTNRRNEKGREVKPLFVLD